MQSPGLRFSLRWLMAEVAVAGWIAYNIHLWAGFEHDLPPHDAARVTTFRIAACVISPLAGGIVALVFWSVALRRVEGLVQALVRGMIGGAVAGMVAWSIAAILLCIGHGADGQTPLFAIIMGMMGAAVHIVPGMLVALVLWRSRPS